MNNNSTYVAYIAFTSMADDITYSNWIEFDLDRVLATWFESGC